MFEYCTRSIISITSTIGNFLSHDVKWITTSGKLYSPKTINKWDRKKIATRYLEEYFCPSKYDPEYSGIGGVENRERFINEVAVKIDELIPKRYFVKYHQISKKYGTTDGSYLPSYFLGKDNHPETKDLIYVYTDEKKSKPKASYKVSGESPATEKQLSYLESLVHESGFLVKNINELNRQTASIFINFLKGDGEQPDNLFDFLEYE